MKHFNYVVIVLTIITLANAQATTPIADDSFYNDPIYDKFFFVRNITCNSSNCPSPNYCVQNNAVCRCGSGFANYNAPGASTGSTSGPYCQYTRKKEVTAFLLQFFIFFVGAGQFYAGNIQYAVPQLLLSLLAIILGVVKSVFKINYSAGEDEKGEEIQQPWYHPLVWWTFELLCVLLFFWWLSDLIILGMNNYLDSYGIPLFNW